MSEEPSSQATQSQNQAEYSAAASLSASSLVIAQETMEHFLQTADLSTVYGDPIEHEGMSIIPTAEVLCIMGFGVGSGGGGEPPAARAEAAGAAGACSAGPWL